MPEANVVTSENLAEFVAKKLDLAPIEEKTEQTIEEKHEEAADDKHEEAEALDEHESDDGKEEKPRKKNAFSERIKKLTDQRNAERQARAELEARLKALEEKVVQKQEKDPDAKPDPKDFTDAFDYAEKLADWSAKQAIKKKEQEETTEKAKKEYESKVDSWRKRIEKAREDLEDYDDLVESSEVVISDQVRDAILESEVGPRILYELAKNPETAEKIAKMSVTGALREIGKIEAKIESKTEAKEDKSAVKASKAPEPINPIRSARAPVEAIGSDGNVQVSFAEYKRLRKEGKIK